MPCILKSMIKKNVSWVEAVCSCTSSTHLNIPLSWRRAEASLQLSVWRACHKITKPKFKSDRCTHDFWSVLEAHGTHTFPWDDAIIPHSMEHSMKSRESFRATQVYNHPKASDWMESKFSRIELMSCVRCDYATPSWTNSLVMELSIAPFNVVTAVEKRTQKCSSTTLTAASHIYCHDNEMNVLYSNQTEH